MGRNSNLTVPPGLSNQDRRFAEGIKENLDVMLGHRGDPLQRAVTFQDLLDANIIEFARGINLFNSTNDIVPVVNDIPNLDIPPAPTSLQASGAFQNIILTWNLSLYRGHSFVEVFRHTSDSISSATMVAQVSGFTGVYADPVGSGQTFYYWVRAVNENSVLGPFNSSTGTQGQTAPDVNFLLTTLANAITTSELASSLSTPIAKIDPLETFTGFSSSYSGNSLLTRMGAVETTANGAATSAQLTSEQTTRASADSALSSSITTLQSTVGTNSTSISTQASSINGLEAKYVVKIDNNGAVAGYGLASTANSAGNIVSEFIVNADRFAIMRGGSNTTAASVPFVVQASSTTLNGVTVPAGVYMTDGFIKNGSIVNAKIGDAAIDNAKIANLDAGKINAGTISTSRLNIDGSTLTSSGGVLQVNEINANKVTAGTLSSSRLLLDGVTIDTNNAGRVIIKDLGVNTLQIAGNAVTIPTSRVLATDFSLSTSYTTILDLSWTSTGAPTVVFVVVNWEGFGNAGGYTGSAELRHGSTVVKTFSLSGANNVSYIETLMFNITPSVGSNTVAIFGKENQSFANAITAKAANTSMFVLETKR